MTFPDHDSALFGIKDATAFPMARACGPWSPDALHGGAVAALAAQVIDDHAADRGGHLARLTLELLRPVPRRQLAIEVTALRTGRHVARFDVTLHADAELVARATALCVTATALDIPVSTGTSRQPPPGPEHGLAHLQTCPWQGFNASAIELRHADDAGSPTDATAWVRLCVPVIVGREPTPAARVAAAADFIGGISAPLYASALRCINADLTLHLEHLPTGNWIAIRATTHIGPRGVGTATGQLFDTAGPIGWASQTLVARTANPS